MKPEDGKCILYLLSPPERPFLEVLPGVLGAGVEWFQYRRPGRADREAWDELVKVREVTDRHNVKLIVNNRPDMALGCEAYGVHLGERDLPAEDVKKKWPDLTVGTTQRAGEPLNAAADYYGVGPVFPTETKQVRAEACGWEGIREVLERADEPVVAIGGITPERLTDGPTELFGIAVSGYVWEHSRPAKAVEELRAALTSS